MAGSLTLMIVSDANSPEQGYKPAVQQKSRSVCLTMQQDLFVVITDC